MLFYKKIMIIYKKTKAFSKMCKILLSHPEEHLKILNFSQMIEMLSNFKS